MAKMERLGRTLNCECGNEGFAVWSETENPAYNNWKIDSTPIAVNGDFEVEGQAENATYTCSRCGADAVAGKVQLQR